MRTPTDRYAVVVPLVLFVASVYASPALTFEVRSADVAAAKVEEHLVVLRLESCAARRFHELTTKNIGKPLVISFDGVPVARAHIRAGIAGGHIQFTVADAALLRKIVDLPTVATAPAVEKGCAPDSDRR